MSKAKTTTNPNPDINSARTMLAKHGRPSQLAGPSNAPFRATVLSLLTGVPVVKSNANWHRFRDALFDAAKVSKSREACEATRWDEVIVWLTDKPKPTLVEQPPEPSPNSDRVIAAMHKLRLRGCETLFVGAKTYRVTAKRYSGETRYYFTSEVLITLAETEDTDAFRELLESGRRTSRYSTYLTESGDTTMIKTPKSTKTTTATEAAARNQKAAAASKKSSKGTAKGKGSKVETSEDKAVKLAERTAAIVKLVAGRSKDKPLLRTELGSSSMRLLARDLAKQGLFTRDESDGTIKYYPNVAGAKASTKTAAKKTAAPKASKKAASTATV